MQGFRSKNFIILTFSMIILLIIIFFIYFHSAFNKNTSNVNKNISNVNKNTSNVADTSKLNKETQLQINKYSKYFNPDQSNEALSKINDKSLSDSERYKALENLSFYFSVSYAASHQPEIREFVLSLKNFAKDNFSKYYQEAPFDVGCADPSCGEKPDEEIKQIQKEINDSGISPAYLNTIDKNLEQTIYIPIDQIDEKKYGFKLVISQLKLQNNPKASVAAEKLTNYIKKKYFIEFNDVKIKEPNK